MYLIEIATRFQDVTNLALGANYAADDLFDQNPSLKLATAIVNRNESLSDDVKGHGHTYEFHHETPSDSEPSTVEEKLYADDISYLDDGEDNV